MFLFSYNSLFILLQLFLAKTSGTKFGELLNRGEDGNSASLELLSDPTSTQITDPDGEKLVANIESELEEIAKAQPRMGLKKLNKLKSSLVRKLLKRNKSQHCENEICQDFNAVVQLIAADSEGIKHEEISRNMMNILDKISKSASKQTMEQVKQILDSWSQEYENLLKTSNGDQYKAASAMRNKIKLIVKEIIIKTKGNRNKKYSENIKANDPMLRAQLLALMSILGDIHIALQQANTMNAAGTATISVDANTHHIKKRGIIKNYWIYAVLIPAFAPYDWAFNNVKKRKSAVLLLLWDIPIIVLLFIFGYIWLVFSGSIGVLFSVVVGIFYAIIWSFFRFLSIFH